jgi:hypothetical protein
VIVVDEYLAIRSLLGDVPDGLPDEPMAIIVSAQWWILQRISAPSGGQLSQALSALSPAGRAVFRQPSPVVLEVLDPRPLLDEAARIAARYGNTGLLIAETTAAGLAHGRQLWFGNPRNIGIRLREIADELGIVISLAAYRGRVSTRASSQHDRIGALLADMAEDAGPIPDGMIGQARRIWRVDEIDSPVAPEGGSSGRSNEP